MAAGDNPFPVKYLLWCTEGAPSSRIMPMNIIIIHKHMWVYTHAHAHGCTKNA